MDHDGRQYVCEFGNSRIQIFDSNDRPIEIIGGPGGEPGQFSNPWGVALDSQGNLYVADSQNHRVQKFFRKGVSTSIGVGRSKTNGLDSAGYEVPASAGDASARRHEAESFAALTFAAADRLKPGLYTLKAHSAS